MPTGRSNASALLQKANSQLRGERVPLKSKEEDELAVYLSGLAQKTQQVCSGSFDDYGDISISSGKDGLQRAAKVGGPSASPAAKVPTPAASKFLKKKPIQTAGSSGAGTSSKWSKPDDEDDDDEDDFGDRPYKRESQIVIAGKKKDDASALGKSSALNKVTALTNKIKGRRTDGVPLRHQISRDSDSESEFGRRPGSADASVGRDGRKFLKGRKMLDEEEPPGTGTPSPMHSQKGSKESKKKTHKKDSQARGEIVRTLGNVYLTSEEESLADFIHGLSASDSTFRRPQNLVAKKQQKWRKKTPSPAARKTASPAPHSRSPSPFKRSPSPFGRMSRSHSQDSDNVDSMASEIMDAARTRHDSASSDDPLNINLMDVASLIPVSPRNTVGKRKKSPAKKQKQTSAVKTSSSASIFKASSDNLSRSSKKKSAGKTKPLKKSDSKSSVFESLGVHMVDELLEADVGQGRPPDLSDQSEIVTERSEDGRKAALHHESDSDIITELGAGSRAAPARYLSTEMSLSEEIERSHVGKKSNQKTLVSGSSTEGDYSEDSFESDSRTVTQSLSPKSKRKSRQRTRSETPRQHKIVVEQRELQVTTADTLGRAHQWDTRQTGVTVSGPYGLQYMDPAPVATHVISADALEAMTAYSPGVLALHEMMKAQVELVKNFADIQRRIYHSCLDGIKEDFHYTTLEDTKEYIRQNQKPKMTFKEALELVEQEEGVRS